jgi:hypothetical protein
MTMADSLNTTNLSRRTILGTGIAAAGALAAAAIPALAAPINSDAKLLQLCRNYLRLERAYGRAALKLDNLEKTAREKQERRKAKQKPSPPRPEVLRGDLNVWPEATGPFGLVDLKAQDVRETLRKVADGSYTIFACFLPGGDRKSMKGVPPPEAGRAEARRLIAVYDDWVAQGGNPQPKRSRRSSAVVKADRALERIYQMQEATAAAIAALPAQTGAGIGAKLQVVTANPDYTDGRDQFGSKYPPLVAIGASLMRDLERIEINAKLATPLAA